MKINLNTVIKNQMKGCENITPKRTLITTYHFEHWHGKDLGLVPQEDKKVRIIGTVIGENDSRMPTPYSESKNKGINPAFVGIVGLITS